MFCILSYKFYLICFYKMNQENFPLSSHLSLLSHSCWKNVCTSFSLNVLYGAWGFKIKKKLGKIIWSRGNVDELLTCEKVIKKHNKSTTIKTLCGWNMSKHFSIYQTNFSAFHFHGNSTFLKLESTHRVGNWNWGVGGVWVKALLFPVLLLFFKMFYCCKVYIFW